MKNYFKKTFALSDKGASDLVKAILCIVVVNLLVISMSTIIFLFLKDSLLTSLDNSTPEFKLIVYIIYVLVTMLLLLLAYFASYNASYFAAYKESSTKRLSLAETMRKLPLSFFGKKDLSDVTTTIMSDTNTLEQAFSHYMPDFFGSLVSTTIITIGMLCFNYKMAIATLWVVPIAFILCFLTRKKQNKLSKKSLDIKLAYDDKIAECIDNIKDIKSNNQKESHKEVMNIKLKDFEKSSIKAELGTGIPVVSAQMILKIGMATSMLAGIYLLSINELDILTFIVFMMVSTRIFDPLAGGLINLAAIFHSFLSIDRMKELENTKIQTGLEEFNPNGYDISFNNVRFSYNDESSVLNGVNFTAKQGEITALVGPSGGGKSTSMKLAARFWDVEEGNICIGGVDINTIDPETLLKSISIVFQDVTLFNNSVLENIRIGRANATDEEVISAAKAARCHEFVEKLKDGYNTFIGENGATLSGGERQRLSIARALLKDAPIILLDEATSSLDIQSESLVQEAISKLTKNKTVIVIAHRMRTIAGANKIVLLKDGVVTEQGNHQELIKLNKDYAKMIELQLKSMTWSVK